MKKLTPYYILVGIHFFVLTIIILNLPVRHENWDGTKLTFLFLLSTGFLLTGIKIGQKQHKGKPLFLSDLDENTVYMVTKVHSKTLYYIAVASASIRNSRILHCDDELGDQERFIVHRTKYNYPKGEEVEVMARSTLEIRKGGEIKVLYHTT